MDILIEKATFHIFASLFSRGQLLKVRICSFRSKFFPLRVDPASESYLIQRNKQEYIFGKEVGGGGSLEQGLLLGVKQ